MLGELSVRERKLVQGIVSGMPVKSAALSAGYPPSVADSTVYQVLRKDKIKETIEELMEKAGLGNEALFRVHADMLKATKPISAIIGKDANSQTMDWVEVPDWTARGSGLNMAYKLKGLYQDQSINVSVESHEERMARLMGK